MAIIKKNGGTMFGCYICCRVVLCLEIVVTFWKEKSKRNIDLRYRSD